MIATAARTSTTTMGDRAPKRAKAAAAGAGIDGAGTATAPASLLDVSDFERIRGEMQRYDEQREKIIKTSRDVQKLSKHAIFALHRRDESKADDQLNKAMEIAKELHPLIANEPNLRYGSYSNAMEEYAEARLFQGWLREGRLLPISQIEGTSNEEYLGGVLDFCGELNRLSVARATARDVDAVRRSRDLVEDVMAEVSACARARACALGCASSLPVLSRDRSLAHRSSIPPLQSQLTLTHVVPTQVPEI